MTDNHRTAIYINSKIVRVYAHRDIVSRNQHFNQCLHICSQKHSFDIGYFCPTFGKKACIMWLWNSLSTIVTQLLTFTSTNKIVLCNCMYISNLQSWLSRYSEHIENNIVFKIFSPNYSQAPNGHSWLCGGVIALACVARRESTTISCTGIRR